MHPTHLTHQPRLAPLAQVAQPAIPQRAVTSRGYDLLLYLVLAGATVPLGQMLAALPWGARLPALSLPVALAGGLLCGILGMAAHTAADSVAERFTPQVSPAEATSLLPPGIHGMPGAPSAPSISSTLEQRHARASTPVLAVVLAPFGLAPFLVAGATLGCVILAAAAHVTLATPVGIDPGLILLGAVAGFLGALMPYTLLVHSGWMEAGLFAVVAVISWHGAVLNREQHIWLLVLVVLIGILIAGERIRRLARWRAAITLPLGKQHTRRGIGNGPGIHLGTRLPVWSTLMALLLALLGTLLASVIQVSAPPLQNLWRESPLLRRSPLTSSAVQTTPTVQLGADLTLSAPALQGNTIVLWYNIVSPPAAALTPPPLLGTTLDTYANGRWTQSHDPAAPWPGFSPPADAPQLVAQVTLNQVLRAGDQIVLPGLSMAVEYSVSGAQPQLLAIPPADITGSGNDTGIDALQACLLTTDWITADTPAVTSGITYTVHALGINQDAAAAAPGELPSDPVAYGWDAATYTRMTALPDALAATLRDDVRQWSGPSGATGAISQGAVVRAQALADFFRRQMVLDPSWRPSTSGGDATIADFLATRRGNAATYVTTYALLLRALGYPTRIVEGFAPPSFHNGQQAVRASDFLYWAQIALPGVGWVDLIPTGERVPIALSGPEAGAGQAHQPLASSTPPTPTTAASNPTAAPPPHSSDVSPFALFNQVISPPTLLIAGVVVVLILLALLLLLFALTFGNLVWVRRSAGPARYRDVVRVLRASLRLAVLANLAQFPAGATPDEAARLMANGLAAISPQAPEATPATPAIQALLQLTEEYQQGRFGAAAENTDALSTLAQNDLADLAITLRIALYPRLLRILWATVAHRMSAASQASDWRTPILPTSGHEWLGTWPHSAHTTPRGIGQPDAGTL